VNLESKDGITVLVEMCSWMRGNIERAELQLVTIARSFDDLYISAQKSM
jgi:hypothetical protein